MASVIQYAAIKINTNAQLAGLKASYYSINNSLSTNSIICNLPVFVWLTELLTTLMEL